MRAITRLLQSPHSVDVLLLLHDRETPLNTKEVMDALEVKNWATISKTLRALSVAKILVMEERSVGRYRSRAKFWALEPNYGTKVASMLHDADKLLSEAANPSAVAPKEQGRTAIVDIDSAGEKIVAVIQNVMKVTR